MSNAVSDVYKVFENYIHIYTRGRNAQLLWRFYTRAYFRKIRIPRKSSEAKSFSHFETFRLLLFNCALSLTSFFQTFHTREYVLNTTMLDSSTNYK